MNFFQSLLTDFWEFTKSLTVGAVEAYVQELFAKIAQHAREARSEDGPSVSVTPPAAAQTFRSVPSWQASKNAE